MSERARVDREAVRLPVRPFLYTLDQVGTIINVTETTVIRDYCFFVGRTPGMPKPDELRTVNIAPATKRPVWRIEERELVRWMKRKGFQFVG